MDDKAEKIVGLAASVFSCPIRDFKLTYFGGSKTWVLTGPDFIFRVNGEPYSATSLEDLEVALIAFKNGL